MASLFNFLIVPLQIVDFKLIKLNLLIFLPCFIILVLHLRTYLKESMPHRFFSLFFSGSFIVLHLTFGSMIHFELVSVNGVKSLPRFIYFFAYGHPIFLELLVEKTIPAPLNCLCYFSKTSSLYLCESVAMGLCVNSLMLITIAL